MIQRAEVMPPMLPSVAAARIKALCEAYSETVGVDIFVQTVDGVQTAVFGGMDGSFSLVAFDNADFEELDAYFSFLNAAVFCDATAAERLNTRKCTVSTLYELETAFCVTSDNGNGSIAEVYGKLQNGIDGDITLPPFEFWYTDFCVRFNHGAAEYAANDNAAAVCGFMTEEISLITGVAVAESCRGRGEGARVLQALIHNIRKKYPHSRIFAATETAAGFYQKNGFKHAGTVAVCEF